MGLFNLNKRRLGEILVEFMGRIVKTHQFLLREVMGTNLNIGNSM